SECGGNPFFLQELARGMARGAAQAVAPVATSTGVPEAVRTVLTTELASLSASARGILQGAAVVGDPFEDELAAVAADTGPDEALAALDELLNADLIRPTAAGRFAFRHPIVRAAVYESVGRAYQVRAHGRLATALAERGASVVARAHHVERSAQVGDEAAAAVF